MVGVPLPIWTSILQACVTEPVKPFLHVVVVSSQMHVYISQTDRGEFLMGSEIEPYPTFSNRGTLGFVEALARHILELFPMLHGTKILRQWPGLSDMTPDYSPIMGVTEVDGFIVDCGWGTYGFKASPIVGTTLAALVATGTTPKLIEPFRLERFSTDMLVSELAAAAVSHNEPEPCVGAGHPSPARKETRMAIKVPSNLEIAQAHRLEPIADVAARYGLEPDEYDLYGKYKAKVDLSVIERLAAKPDGKLVCVTAITPTKAGEGKTTTSVSLTQGLGKIGRKPVLCLREPSLGPVFGIKGGAAGGGFSQVVPMEDLNLHFTGDIHAIGAANNLLAAALEAHLLHGNKLGVDPLTIGWRRCMDMNDRSLRQIALGLGGRANGYPRETGFDITAASEVMAIVAVANDLGDLRRRLGAITVGYTFEGEPVTAEDLKAAGAMTVLLKETLKPNLIQTLEGQACLMHAGPFANIAHGNNSLVADKVALKLGDFCVTESGFGSDMGMEKFLDIVCRMGGLTPSAVVVVTTIRALKHHAEDPDGGLDAIERGSANLERHLGIVKEFGLEPVVAVNRRPEDTEEECERRAQARARVRGLRRRAQRRLSARGRRCRRARRGGRRSLRPAEQVRAGLRARRADRRQDREDRDARLRREGGHLPPRCPREDRALHEGRSRQAADLHGEDTPLALARSVAHGRPERLHLPGPRPSLLHRLRLDRRALRRHADDARVRSDACVPERRHRHRRPHGRPLLAAAVTRGGRPCSTRDS